jgi:hypothetical protein
MKRYMASAARVSEEAFRHTVLVAANRFKATWFELGKLLIKVRDDALFEPWGYETFEDYCWKELRVRRNTALKLTRSFAFLSKYEPKAVQNEEVADRAPPLEVVEVLAGADERGQISADEYRSIRDSIWEEEKPTPELRRELLQRFPRPEVTVTYETQLRRFAQNAKKLAADLRSNRRVPRAIVDRAAALAEDLEELAQGAEAA